MFKLNKKEWSWVLYDVANSAYTLVMTTAIFPLFFVAQATTEIGEVAANSYWGFANSIASILVVLTAPILGTLADFKGVRKKLFTIYLFISIIATILLAFISSNTIILASIFVISLYSYTSIDIFYNSFLLDVTTKDKYEKLSSLGYAFGYIVSLIPFIICLGLILTSNNDETMIRFSFIITALWWLIFSIPLLLNVKQTKGIDKNNENIITLGFKKIYRTIKDIASYKLIAIFLLAYFFYIDGVHTIIVMATPIASTLGIDQTFILLTLIFIQVIAFPFTIIFSYLSKKYGNFKTIFIAIIGYIIIVLYSTFVLSSVYDFLFMGFLIGMFQGGIQAVSRAEFASIIPEEKNSEFFSFYSIFGKVAAILGPSLVGGVAVLTNNTRYGIFSLTILFIIGLFILIYYQFLKSKTHH